MISLKLSTSRLATVAFDESLYRKKKEIVYRFRIKRISNELVSQTPRNMTTMGNPDGNETTNAAHVLHFTDIMEYTIKEVIKFCKKIPTFMYVSCFLSHNFKFNIFSFMSCALTRGFFSQFLYFFAAFAVETLCAGRTVSKR